MSFQSNRDTTILAQRRRDPENRLAPTHHACLQRLQPMRMRILYYAVAERSDGQIGQLLVIRENGRQVFQKWTGVTYRSGQAAKKDLNRLNCSKSQP